MFSIDTESGFDQVVFITSAWGLGEMVVQGAVNPDEFYVHKPTRRLTVRRSSVAQWVRKKSAWSTRQPRNTVSR